MTSATALRLDADHRYWIGDRELISVTTALTEAGLIDRAWFNEDAAARGTYVHEACCLLDVQDLGDVALPFAGYLDGYRRFLEDVRPVWSLSEQRVFCELYDYAGTLDRAGTISGEYVVVDIKTGPAAPWHGAQLAAYARLLPERARRFDLYLTAEGRYALTAQRDRADEALFFAALQIAQYRRRHGYR